MEKRTITLTEKNAPQIFRRCLDWLGKAEVTHKIESVRRELRTERGLYLDYWVRPKNRWWTELSKAIEMDSKGLRFVGRVENISFFFETAAKMSKLYVGMSNAKREEFRRRILNSDNISPVLMEIDMAAHFWQMGFDLEWAESKSKGQKIPEFVCMSETLSYDVECKTKTVDAGRMIAWPRFYRLADLVVEQLRARNLHGDVRIVTPDRLPRDTKWQASVVDAIAKQSPGPSKELVLNDETSITTSLMVKETVIPMQEMNSQIASVQKQFTHVIFHSTARAGTECVNPIIVCAESKRSDAFLKSVLEDLREAKRQLSGKRAGIIVCFVPESFREASNESALRKLTESFFVNHAPDSLHGVTFISDRQTATLANNIETLYPSITFYNSRYDRKWGVATDYMARSF